MQHSPSSLMRFFVSPYEAWMYKYLKVVDPDAAQEDPEDPFMQVASKKGDVHEENLYNDLKNKVDTSVVIVNSDPEKYLPYKKFLEKYRSKALIVAVTKTRPVEDIKNALKAGIRDFGETKVQEAFEKFFSLKAEYMDLQLHMIGGLQTNKVKKRRRRANYLKRHKSQQRKKSNG